MGHGSVKGVFTQVFGAEGAQLLSILNFGFGTILNGWII